MEKIDALEIALALNAIACMVDDSTLNKIGGQLKKIEGIVSKYVKEDKDNK